MPVAASHSHGTKLPRWRARDILKVDLRNVMFSWYSNLASERAFNLCFHEWL